jgi:nicotinate phosphoribosyltransferase
METLRPVHETTQERDLLSAGLDFYKPTMSQLEFERHPDAEVTFAFRNRGSQQLADNIDPHVLQTRFDMIAERGWSEEELENLRNVTTPSGTPQFSEAFLSYLRENSLPPVRVFENAESDIGIETTGAWPLVTFWETVVMSEVNEMYFDRLLQSKKIDPAEVFYEGDRRLTEKIALLQQFPGIKIADFGTRRHFSFDWQNYVLGRLQRECPENLIGTSNVYLANALGLRPIGTFAHEMPMVYAGIADMEGRSIRQSHGAFLEDWYAYYGQSLSIALTDTFTTDFFFEDFTPDQAKKWTGLRHDSGDAVGFGEKAISFYENHGIDPTTKTIVFSDGLDIHKIIELYRHFAGRINLAFGWGTTLTNDLGLKPLNIVMKATAVNGTPTVKLSDDPGKHTGPLERINVYRDEFKKIRIPLM